MIISCSFLLLSLVFGARSSSLSKTGDTQIGCLKCHAIDDQRLNVHLVPHSHDDVGWLKTVDQYYYGLNTGIQQAAVQYIITSVVEALLENPDRRYIQVETAFFWKWWNDQNEDMRQQFKSLVDNGQIEMVNGAWAMNDEACSNYQSTIDQFTWGLRIINETIGACGIPRVGWQIDPFGHSREQASIFAQLGYDGVFFARLDHDDKKQRFNRSAFNFAWQSSANLDNSVIFGGNFPTPLYFPPDGYCWDYSCHDDPIDDDPNSPDYNVKEIVEEFKNIIKQYAPGFPTKNVFIPMGGDFQYEAAEMNYINMDRFIKAFENDTEVNLIYSTPSCFIQAVNKANPKLSLKTDDFFPYSDDLHAFWAGYFTSRADSKRFERTGHNILQVTKQLFALASYSSGNLTSDSDLKYLRDTMGILQHHDAITGTEKDHVSKDYTRLLTRAIETAEKPIGKVIKSLLEIESTGISLDLASCLLSNMTICTTSQNSDKFIALVYNPLAWNVTHFVRLPVDKSNFTIQGSDGKVVYDVVPTLYDFSFVTLPDIKASAYELVFAAEDVPPLGFKTYYIEKTVTDDEVSAYKEITAENGIYTLGDDETNVLFDDKTNLLKSITMNGKTLNIEQNFFFYIGSTGVPDGANGTRASSGAYLFRPNVSEPVKFETVSKLRSFAGNVVSEFHQKWTDDNADIVQSIRWYKNQNYVEFDWIVGDIDINKTMTGKEVITKYAVSDFDNKNVFYTDSNGRETIQRTLNTRPDYKYDASAEPVASNYYPVTSKITIKDDTQKVRVSILTDRSQGGTSLSEGEIELMVHRRLLADDDKGVGENLNELEFGKGLYVRGTHWLVLGNEENQNGISTAIQEKILAQEKLLQPWVGVANATNTYEELQSIVNTSYSPLLDSLPQGINILTFEPWSNSRYILRLERFVEKDDDSKQENVITVDLQKIFKDMQVHDMIETTLGANQNLEDFQKTDKYSWQIDGALMSVVDKVIDSSSWKINLTPMQIRTFIITLEPSFGVIVKPFSLIIFVVLMVVSRIV